jgi:hypothetical protein
LLTVTAKYGGSAGLGIIIGISAANDGNANHFNMTATASGASGTTQEVYPNCNISGTGSDVLPGIGSSVLLGSVVKLASGIPVTGNTTMTGGTSPSVSAADYVGTPGANNNGLALLEADDTIDGVFYDDPGSSLIGTANAGLVSHATLLQDRICYISGPSGQTASAAQTDAIGLSGNINSVYVDPWAYVSDDTDGTLRNCPASCWAASVAAQLPPSVSIAWKADTVKNMLSGIAKLEADRGSTRAANTAAGISTLIKAKNGGFCFEAGVNMSGTAGLTNLTRTRMGIYIAKSAIESWYPFVDAPNVPFFQQDLINSAEAFLATLKRNATVNPAVLPYILDYQILPTSASNTPSTVAAGAFNVASNIKIGSNMSFISLSMAYGETVTVSTS